MIAPDPEPRTVGGDDPDERQAVLERLRSELGEIQLLLDGLRERIDRAGDDLDRREDAPGDEPTV